MKTVIICLLGLALGLASYCAFKTDACKCNPCKCDPCVCAEK